MISLLIEVEDRSRLPPIRGYTPSAPGWPMLLVSGPLPIVNFRYRGSRRLSEKALNRLNESLVSEIQKRGIAIPSLYAIGGKSCVRVCNLNQRSQRSDFEALVQACKQLGVELEARTGHKAVQHVKIRRVAALG